LLIPLMFVLLHGAFASESFLGYVAQGDCVNLLQTCDDCTYNNLSSISLAINSNLVLYEETAMQKKGVVYNYTFCNTSTQGEYNVDGHGDIGGVDTVWHYKFLVNYSGQELKTSQSILYTVLLGFFILIFILTLYFMGKLPTVEENNPQSLMDYGWLKYLKSTLLFVEYMIVIAILFVTSNLAFAYLTEQLLAKVLFVIYKTLFALTPVVLIVWFVWIFKSFMEDKKVKRLWEKGIFPNQGW